MAAGWSATRRYGRQEDNVEILGSDRRATEQKKRKSTKQSRIRGPRWDFSRSAVDGMQKLEGKVGENEAESRARHSDGGPSLPEMAELVGAFRSNGVLQHARSSSWRRPTRNLLSVALEQRKRLWSEADGAISGPMGVRREVPIEGGVSGAS
ncbi:hypothetical protein GE21DRAFT_1065369 [Neurospora crassa]|nr:hypothetical protein GE21DRAFT_1065369 [Neurospora crassa]